ncbi:isoleucyl-tRNA synthetase [Methylacidimicrobium cyclopophantes]|uniref:Isoleucine--tRNA ligase n=1 Tax=Methylacidimicrobium cyclopophantes TaxID=1041766 RepID=A0A5E6MRF3_9BACT|nr:isoleucine--tRNA ligase [Methylacidimicrobium cyclopophantes]VVM08478.1 isoleucyl-tRNA synthetase [Methylacidimicrobium cyclopophantes]
MDYRDTVLLPRTSFPMRAELPKREPLLLERWRRENLYEQILRARSAGPRFILHDGPPFANGDAHLGHALNKTLKDLVLKSRNMMGFFAPYIPGWDCHGLPIETKVVKESFVRVPGSLIPIKELPSGEFLEAKVELPGGAPIPKGEVHAGEEGIKADDKGFQYERHGPLYIRRKCAEYAQRYVEIQREQFERLGIFGDWEHPYRTMDPAYEAEVLLLFADLVEKGLVFEGLRPVFWSIGCRTALAEAEVEYQPQIDPAIDVEFPLLPESCREVGISEDARLLIWTTTPWTLPANLAVALNPELPYGLYSARGRHLLVAEARAHAIPGLENAPCVRHFPRGEELLGLRYRHPLLPRTGLVYGASFVTGESGTGFVHIAPGHGMEDYLLGQEHGLPPLSPVDDEGRFTEECGLPELVGLSVREEGNPKIIELLESAGFLWAKRDYEHDYPHCWRSKTPIIFRSVRQWFIDVKAFQQEALRAIEEVEWLPARARNRIRGAVESRRDWCVSRQRYWGIPLPVFYRPDGSAVLEPEAIRKLAREVAKEGTDLWYATDEEALARKLGLPAGLRKGADTLDVWIDSGSSHAAVLRPRGEFPADLYLEGSDQHRGWFQSSLLLSVARSGQAPYRTVLTNGFVMDLDGRKLSKMAGARGLPEFISQFGADIVRLWVASEDYRDDVPFSQEILSRISDTYRLLRNSFRILLANLHDFDPSRNRVSEEDFPELERYMADRLRILVRTVVEAYRRYEFPAACHALTRFCSTELSAFYIDVLKDRLYCDAADGTARRASQTLLHRMAESLFRLAAPILPFTAEEAWEALGKKASVHLELFPEEAAPKSDPPFAERWTRILELRALSNEALEVSRRAKEIGKALEAEVEVQTPHFDSADEELLAEVFLVSRVRVRRGESPAVRVRPASGRQCARCWKYSEEVGKTDPAHPALCPRCTGVVQANRSRS